MALCINCGRRPRPKDNSRMRCRPCQWDLERIEREARKKARNRPGNLAKYWKVVHWKGDLVGIELLPVDPDAPFFSQKRTRATFIRYIEGDPKALARVPQSKLINLDQWLPAFSADQIKGMKATMRRVSPLAQKQKSRR